MRDKMIKPSTPATKRATILRAKNAVAQILDAGQGAAQLSSLAASELNAMLEMLPDIERSIQRIDELALELDLERMIEGLKSDRPLPTPLTEAGAESLFLWRGITEAERTRRTLRLLAESLGNFAASWASHRDWLTKDPEFAPAAIRRANIFEADLERALSIIRERQQEANRLKRDLSEAQRLAADRGGEIERLQRAVQHLRAQLDEAQAFGQMLASSTSWKLARALMLPARFMPPIVRRLARALLRRVTMLLHRLRRFCEERIQKIQTVTPVDFSRDARRRSTPSIATGLDIIIALPDDEVPSADVLDQWIALAGPQTAIVVCATPHSAPPAQVVFVPRPPERDWTQHIDGLIRNSVSSTAVVVTGTVVPDAAALETFAPIFANNHRTIAACGVLVDNNARIRSAGLASMADGHLHAAGAGQPVDGYAWSSITRVDALSPPIVAFDVDAYGHVGGLKPHPQGYVGALAAFSIEADQRAFQVVFNPFAPISSSVAVVPPFKAGPFVARRQKRVLFADAATPTPDRDSGSLDLVWYMRIFQDMGYDVTFLPLTDRQPSRHVDDLRRMGVATPLEAEFAEPWHFLRDHGFEFDIVVLSRVTVACHLIDPVKTFAPQAKVIFDTVDLHFLREERAAALAGSEALKMQAARTKLEEFRVMDLSDTTIVRSEVEAAIIQEAAPSIRTHVVPIVRPVTGRLTPLEDRRDMIFVGGFQHAPNLDAFELLHGEIWPRIRALLPEVRIHIIGSGAPASVIDRHDPGNGFIVEGYVADLNDFYRSARVNLAPLRYGAGLKGKLVASLANGIPSVATPVAAEGMNLEDESTILLASDPAAFAEAAVRLYTDAWLWTRLSDRGAVFAQQRFSVPVVRRGLETLLANLADPA